MEGIKHEIIIRYGFANITYGIEFPFRLMKGDFFDFELLKNIGVIRMEFQRELIEDVIWKIEGGYINEISICMGDGVIVIHFDLDKIIADKKIKSDGNKIYKSLVNLKEGDFVECVKVNKQSVDTLTKGKKYEVFYSDNHRFCLYNDRGKKSKYNTRTQMFKVI